MLDIGESISFLRSCPWHYIFHDITVAWHDILHDIMHDICMTHSIVMFSDIKKQPNYILHIMHWKVGKLYNFLFFEVFLHDIWFCMTLCMTYGWQMHDMCISDAWQTHHSTKSWIFLDSMWTFLLRNIFCMTLCMTLYTMHLCMTCHAVCV